MFYLCIEITIKQLIIMARPIKDTPVVTGKDAEKFAERLANPTLETKEEKAAAKKAFEAVKAISTFML